MLNSSHFPGFTDKAIHNPPDMQDPMRFTDADVAYLKTLYGATEPLIYVYAAKNKRARIRDARHTVYANQLKKVVEELIRIVTLAPLPVGKLTDEKLEELQTQAQTKPRAGDKQRFKISDFAMFQLILFRRGYIDGVKIQGMKDDPDLGDDVQPTEYYESIKKTFERLLITLAHTGQQSKLQDKALLALAQLVDPLGYCANAQTTAIQTALATLMLGDSLNDQLTRIRRQAITNAANAFLQTQQGQAIYEGNQQHVDTKFAAELCEHGFGIPRRMDVELLSDKALYGSEAAANQARTFLHNALRNTYFTPAVVNSCITSDYQTLFAELFTRKEFLDQFNTAEFKTLAPKAAIAEKNKRKRELFAEALKPFIDAEIITDPDEWLQDGSTVVTSGAGAAAVDNTLVIRKNFFAYLPYMVQQLLLKTGYLITKRNTKDLAETEYAAIECSFTHNTFVGRAIRTINVPPHADLEMYGATDSLSYFCLQVVASGFFTLEQLGFREITHEDFRHDPHVGVEFLKMMDKDECIVHPYTLEVVKLSPDFQQLLGRYQLELLTPGFTSTNPLQLGVKREGPILQYQALSPSGQRVTGEIPLEELELDPSAEISLDEIQNIQADVLEITTKRGHTYSELMLSHREALNYWLRLFHFGGLEQSRLIGLDPGWQEILPHFHPALLRAEFLALLQQKMTPATLGIELISAFGEYLRNGNSDDPTEEAQFLVTTWIDQAPTHAIPLEHIVYVPKELRHAGYTDIIDILRIEQIAKFLQTAQKIMPLDIALIFTRRYAYAEDALSLLPQIVKPLLFKGSPNFLALNKFLQILIQHGERLSFNEFTHLFLSMTAAVTKRYCRALFMVTLPAHFDPIRWYLEVSQLSDEEREELLNLIEKDKNILDNFPIDLPLACTMQLPLKISLAEGDRPIFDGIIQKINEYEKDSIEQQIIKKCLFSLTKNSETTIKDCFLVTVNLIKIISEELRFGLLKEFLAKAINYGQWCLDIIELDESLAASLYFYLANEAIKEMIEQLYGEITLAALMEFLAKYKITSTEFNDFLSVMKNARTKESKAFIKALLQLQQHYTLPEMTALSSIVITILHNGATREFSALLTIIPDIFVNNDNKEQLIALLVKPLPDFIDRAHWTLTILSLATTKDINRQLWTILENHAACFFILYPCVELPIAIDFIERCKVENPELLTTLESLIPRGELYPLFIDFFRNLVTHHRHYALTTFAELCLFATLSLQSAQNKNLPEILTNFSSKLGSDELTPDNKQLLIGIFTTELPLSIRRAPWGKAVFSLPTTLYSPLAIQLADPVSKEILMKTAPIMALKDSIAFVSAFSKEEAVAETMEDFLEQYAVAMSLRKTHNLRPFLTCLLAQYAHYTLREMVGLISLVNGIIQSAPRGLPFPEMLQTLPTLALAHPAGKNCVLRILATPLPSTINRSIWCNDVLLLDKEQALALDNLLQEDNTKMALFLHFSAIPLPVAIDFAQHCIEENAFSIIKTYKIDNRAYPVHVLKQLNQHRKYTLKNLFLLFNKIDTAGFSDDEARYLFNKIDTLNPAILSVFIDILLIEPIGEFKAWVTALIQLKEENILSLKAIVDSPSSKTFLFSVFPQLFSKLEDAFLFTETHHAEENAMLRARAFIDYYKDQPAHGITPKKFYKNLMASHVRFTLEEMHELAGIIFSISNSPAVSQRAAAAIENLPANLATHSERKIILQILLKNRLDPLLYIKLLQGIFSLTAEALRLLLSICSDEKHSTYFYSALSWTSNLSTAITFTEHCVRENAGHLISRLNVTQVLTEQKPYFLTLLEDHKRYSICQLVELAENIDEITKNVSPKSGFLSGFSPAPFDFERFITSRPDLSLIEWATLLGAPLPDHIKRHQWFNYITALSKDQLLQVQTPVGQHLLITALRFTGIESALKIATSHMTEEGAVFIIDELAGLYSLSSENAAMERYKLAIFNSLLYLHPFGKLEDFKTIIALIFSLINTRSTFYFSSSDLPNRETAHEASVLNDTLSLKVDILSCLVKTLDHSNNNIALCMIIAGLSKEDCLPLAALVKNPAALPYFIFALPWINRGHLARTTILEAIAFANHYASEHDEESATALNTLRQTGTPSVISLFGLAISTYHPHLTLVQLVRLANRLATFFPDKTSIIKPMLENIKRHSDAIELYLADFATEITEIERQQIITLALSDNRLTEDHRINWCALLARQRRSFSSLASLFSLMSLLKKIDYEVSENYQNLLPCGMALRHLPAHLSDEQVATLVMRSQREFPRCVPASDWHTMNLLSLNSQATPHYLRLISMSWLSSFFTYTDALPAEDYLRVLALYNGMVGDQTLFIPVLEQACKLIATLSPENRMRILDLFLQPYLPEGISLLTWTRAIVAAGLDNAAPKFLFEQEDKASVLWLSAAFENYACYFQLSDLTRFARLMRDLEALPMRRLDTFKNNSTLKIFMDVKTILVSFLDFVDAHYTENKETILMCLSEYSANFDITRTDILYWQEHAAYMNIPFAERVEFLGTCEVSGKDETAYFYFDEAEKFAFTHPNLNALVQPRHKPLLIQLTRARISLLPLLGINPKYMSTRVIANVAHLLNTPETLANTLEVFGSLQALFEMKYHQLENNGKVVGFFVQERKRRLLETPSLVVETAAAAPAGAGAANPAQADGVLLRGFGPSKT